MKDVASENFVVALSARVAIKLNQRKIHNDGNNCGRSEPNILKRINQNNAGAEGMIMMAATATSPEGDADSIHPNMFLKEPRASPQMANPPMKILRIKASSMAVHLERQGAISCEASCGMA